MTVSQGKEDLAAKKQALLTELAELERKSLEQKVAEINAAIRVISWRDTMGNRYRQKLHPAMLLDCGHVERRKILPLGTKRVEFSDSRQWIDVHYDHAYVTEKIVIEILRPLRITSRERFDALVSEVWAEWERALDDAKVTQNVTEG